MCGIAGIIRNTRRAEVSPDLAQADAETVARMLAAQLHRGPDAEGLYRDSGVVLGHRRLSIIDLSPAGRQPMSNEDASVWITFNGEIYNHRDLRLELLSAGHRFHSDTDTEVLLHGYEQWGIVGLLGRLRGMFAFALYDKRRGLIMARDRLGIKPLYYHAAADFIAFASEVKALLRGGVVPAERDRTALAGFLIAGAVPAPRTMIEGIRCLEAGHWLEFKDGSVGIHKYWDLECPPKEYTSLDPRELQSTLEDAVRGHLISDVPLGVFLSGGVDSAALVALASHIRKEQGDPLTTLTVVFDEKEFNEASAASEIAKRFQTRHHEVRVTSADFHREMPAFIAAMDQPTNDGVNSYFVSKAAREAGLTVVLSGMGGDEVFWGYKHYHWLRLGRFAGHCPAPLRRLAAGAGYQWGRLRGRDNWMRTAWLRSAGSSERVYLTMRGFFAPDQVARLMDMNQSELDAVVEESFGPLGNCGDINYIEMKRYLHDQLLRDTDVFSMAHSIEVRVPYLDHILVEKLWHTSPSLKLDKAMNKPLLVRAVNDASVEQASARPKLGFTFPMARWMKTAAPEMREMAENASLVKSAVRDCWADFSEGKMHWSRAWALTVLGATHQTPQPPQSPQAISHQQAAFSGA
jgi:asparagine synthase (glutamine-hydrolysing)